MRDSAVVNETAVIREFFVRTGTDVYDIAGDRVYIPAAPPISVFDGSINAGLVISPTGGEPKGRSSWLVPYQIKCYGGSGGMERARQLARAVIDLVRSSGVTLLPSGTWLGGKVETGAQQIYDDNTAPHWAYVLVQVRCGITA